MRLATRRSALGIFAFGFTLAACGRDIPTDVRGQNPPTRVPVPAPVPAPPRPTDFPQLSRPGVIYQRTTPSEVPGQQRYVIYDDGTFGLQYLRPDWGFFEYAGRYLRAGSQLTLNFNDANTAGPWEAHGVLAADSSLTVTYNVIMMLADFEDGTYRLLAP
jgi:hypothetical protein